MSECGDGFEQGITLISICSSTYSYAQEVIILERNFNSYEIILMVMVRMSTTMTKTMTVTVLVAMTMTMTMIIQL